MNLRIKHRDQNWWNRPCGGREVLALTLPLVISTGSWSVMMFVDRMFLMWYSSDMMAATMPAGMLYWTMICFPLGMAGYVNTFVAQYYGAQRPERIGAATWQGLRIGWYFTPVFLCAIPLAPLIFAWAGHDPLVQAYEVIYFQLLTFAAGGAVISAGQAAFFTGRGVTRVVMQVDVAAMFLNVGLNYVWIFGHFGFPAMGLEGAAYATIASTWFKVLVFGLLMYREPTRLTYHLISTRRFDRALFRRLVVFGGPSGLQFLVEGASFSLTVLLMGRFGRQAMTASTLAFNVNSVAFVPMLGIGIATSTLVGQQLTRGRPDLAARATWTAFAFALIYTTAFGLLYVLAPDLFLLGHAAGVAEHEFGPIRDLTVILLRFVAAYCLFDAMQMVFVGAIKGAGDTWFVLVTTIWTSALGIAACWIASRWGLIGWWYAVTGWICLLGLVYLVRFLQGRWRTMRVIEAEYAVVES
jgi:multidrug resistance protein, MATE family